MRKSFVIVDKLKEAADVVRGVVNEINVVSDGVENRLKKYAKDAGVYSKPMDCGEGKPVQKELEH